MARSPLFVAAVMVGCGPPTAAPAAPRVSTATPPAASAISTGLRAEGPAERVAAVPRDDADPVTPAPPAAEPAPRRRIADGPTDEEHLSRPDKQWRWIQRASDDTCRTQLEQTQARFLAVPDRDEPNAHGCGIPRAVALMRGPTGVRYQPAIRVDCSFALRLGEIEALLHEEATERFGARVVSLGTVGSYACRPVKGRLKGWSGGISEHSFGNALDITHVDLDTGRRISVVRDYPRDRAPAERPGGMFLRAVVARIWDETGMRALSPDFDKSHLGHLHFDAGSRWWRLRSSASPSGS